MRKKMTPHDWIKPNQLMIEWAKKYLIKNGSIPFTHYQTPQEAANTIADHIARNGPDFFKLMQGAWNKKVHDAKHKKNKITINLDALAHEKIKTLSQGRPMRHAAREIISNAHQLEEIAKKSLEKKERELKEKYGNTPKRPKPLIIGIDQKTSQRITEKFMSIISHEIHRLVYLEIILGELTPSLHLDQPIDKSAEIDSRHAEKMNYLKARLSTSILGINKNLIHQVKSS